MAEILATTEKQIRDILEREHGIDEMAPKETFTDVGLDSLDHTELMMNVESAFKMEIPDEDQEDLDTLPKLVAYVDRRKTN